MSTEGQEGVARLRALGVPGHSRGRPRVPSRARLAVSVSSSLGGSFRQMDLPEPCGGLADRRHFSTGIHIKLLGDVPGKQEHVEPQGAEVWEGASQGPAQGDGLESDVPSAHAPPRGSHRPVSPCPL